MWTSNTILHTISLLISTSQQYYIYKVTFPEILFTFSVNCRKFKKPELPDADILQAITVQSWLDNSANKNLHFLPILHWLLWAPFLYKNIFLICSISRSRRMHLIVLKLRLHYLVCMYCLRNYCWIILSVRIVKGTIVGYLCTVLFREQLLDLPLV